MPNVRWDLVGLVVQVVGIAIVTPGLLAIARRAPALARVLAPFLPALALFAAGNVASAFHWFRNWPPGYAIAVLLGYGFLFWAWRKSQRLERDMAASRGSARPSVE